MLDEEKRVDEVIEEIKRTRFVAEGGGIEMERYERYGFVTREDIARVEESGQVLVAVRPPEGSMIEVYSPEQIQQIYMQMGLDES